MGRTYQSRRIGRGLAAVAVAALVAIVFVQAQERQVSFRLIVVSSAERAREISTDIIAKGA